MFLRNLRFLDWTSDFHSDAATLLVNEVESVESAGVPEGLKVGE
jgi:hypothetical protein